MPVSEHIEIDGKPYKQYTARGMLFGQVAEVPATPFAQKRSQGDPTLADSLTLSYFGMDSFHGGRGQDKARSPFSFMDSKNLISFIRDRAIPGPKPHVFLAGTGVMHKPGNVYTEASVDNGYGESFVCPAGGLSITKLQFRLRRLSHVYPDITIYFRLRADSSGLPGAMLKEVAITWDDLEYSWKWIKGTFSAYAGVGGTTYWACVESTDWAGDVGIALDPDAGYSGTFAGLDGSWVADPLSDLYFKINKGQQVDRTPTDAIEFYGSREVRDREEGSLSYTTEGADQTFTDDGQDFTDWETTSGNAAFLIRVHNDDGTVSWGYLGAKVTATEIKVYSDRARTTSAWKGDSTGTPESYSVHNTTVIPPTLFFIIGKGVYYTDETAEGGYATAGGSTYLRDANATFGVDTYNTGYTLYLIGGKGMGQSRDITDTTEHQLTVAAWDEEPNNTTRYVVRKNSPDLQNSKTDFKNQITDATVFKDKLYIAQGWRGRKPMWTLSGFTPATDWAKVTGEVAEHLCVHVNADGDEALWRSVNHKISTSTDGTNFGTEIEVGDEQYPVTGMTVYAGDFIAFKEDGWYLIDLEQWTAEMIVDFTSQPERDAFKANAEYAGEQYGGKGAGVWRYTPGPDMTPVGPDRGAVGVDPWEWPGRPWSPSRVITPRTRERSGWGLPEIRLGKVSALEAVTNFMYVAMDAGNEDDRYSSILVYNRVGYHEIISADNVNEGIRVLHFSPEISPTPRLWWSEGRAIKYAKIPDLGDNPYLWALAEYIEEAEVETSRYDAGRPTHRKTLMECGVQSEGLLAGSREIDVYYEADRSGLLVLWGTITRSPYEKLYMAASNIGANKTVASGSTTTVIKVDSTTGIVPGEWVRIGIEHRQVASVDSSTQLTVTLPFSSAPASGITVYGGWPVVYDVALTFRGTTDDATKGWALCGFAGGWLPRPRREWSRTVILEIADDVVKGRAAADMWEDLQALADRPEPITYKDYWGNEHNVFVLEPTLRPLGEEEDAIDKHIDRAYAEVRMLDATLS